MLNFIHPFSFEKNKNLLRLKNNKHSYERCSQNLRKCEFSWGSKLQLQVLGKNKSVRRCFSMDFNGKAILLAFFPHQGTSTALLINWPSSWFLEMPHALEQQQPNRWLGLRFDFLSKSVHHIKTCINFCPVKRLVMVLVNLYFI